MSSGQVSQVPPGFLRWCAAPAADLGCWCQAAWCGGAGLVSEQEHCTGLESAMGWVDYRITQQQELAQCPAARVLVAMWGRQCGLIALCAHHHVAARQHEKHAAYAFMRSKQMRHHGL